MSFLNKYSAVYYKAFERTYENINKMQRTHEILMPEDMTSASMAAVLRVKNCFAVVLKRGVCELPSNTQTIANAESLHKNGVFVIAERVL